MPEEMGDEPRPGIVFVHGGGWRSGDKRRTNFLGPAIEFAAKGYVCISTNYRLLSHAPFPACVEDVKCAVRWLRAHAEDYNLDPNHIGAYGNSAGAHLVAMLGLCPPSAGLEGDGPWQEHSSMVQAVVCSATPSSFLVPMNDRARRQPPSNGQRGRSRGRMSGNLSDEMRKKISPITYVSADAPPFMIVHDTSDRTVAVRHGDDLHKALTDAGARVVTYLRYDDGYGHGVWGGNAAALVPAREIFFAGHLKKSGRRASSRPSGRSDTQKR
jgi:acetyl esterase/lipase